MWAIRDNDEGSPHQLHHGSNQLKVCHMYSNSMSACKSHFCEVNILEELFESDFKIIHIL